MEKLIIKNVGPIKNVDFDLNKVNVFIGPQSSGKSTIAKVISFCKWLHKDIVGKQSTSHVNCEFVKKELIEHHNFISYFDKNSYVYYEDNLIIFRYSNEHCDLNVKSKIEEDKLSKIAYIPSERNILCIPSIITLELPKNYIRDFLFSWFLLRNKYTKENPISLLDLNIKYYYDVSRGDILVLENGKEITLMDVSSGVQSMTPLFVYVDYVTKWIYENDVDTSYSKYNAEQRVLTKLMDGLYRPEDESQCTPNELDELLQVMLSQANNASDAFTRDKFINLIKNIKTPRTYDMYISLKERISKAHYTNLVVEEPELNIFPKTQYELVKYMIGSMNFERGDSLVLTTHSPYIMSSLNNLIEGDNALKAVEGKGISEEDKLKAKGEIHRIIEEQCVLPYEYVSAWMVENGTIRSINDDEYRLISADALDSVSDVIGDEYNKLLDYEY